MKSADRVPQEMRQVYENIVGLTDEFCQTHLNQEYAGLCRASSRIIRWLG